MPIDAAKTTDLTAADRSDMNNKPIFCSGADVPGTNFLDGKGRFGLIF